MPHSRKIAYKRKGATCPSIWEEALAQAGRRFGPFLFEPKGIGDMSKWPSTNAKKVYRALQRIGWAEKPRISKSGSHKQLENPNFPYEYTWAFHDGDEIGPKMLARIAKQTGLKPEDL